MKKKRRLFLCCLMTLLMAFVMAVPASVSADELTEEVTVEDVSALVAAFSNPDVTKITLGKNTVNIGPIKKYNYFNVEEAINVSRTLTLDLNGGTLSLSSDDDLKIGNGGTLIVENSSPDSGDGINCGAQGILVSDGGQLLINGGTISGGNNKAAISVKGSDSKLTASGGTVKGSSNNGIGISVSDNANVEIKGTANITGYTALSVDQDGNAMIDENCTIKTTSKYAVSVNAGNTNGSLTINGGTITCDASSDSCAIFLGNNGVIEFNEGIIENIQGGSSKALSLSGGTFTMNGGEIKSETRTSSQAKQAVALSNSAKFIMNGGSIESETLGITTSISGTGSFDESTITINAGTINAKTYALQGRGECTINPDNAEKVTITGGAGIVSPDYVAVGTIISGGIFSHNVSEFVKDENKSSIAFISSEGTDKKYYVGADADNVIKAAEAGDTITALKNIKTLNVNEGVLVVNNIANTPITVNGSDVPTGTEPVKATHDMTHHAAVPATCEEEGNVEYWHCSICNKNFKDAEGEQELTELTTPAIGHKWSEWTTVTEPTCTEKGRQQRTCEVCSVTESQELDATGHDWEAGYTVDKEATCTEAGSESIHCSKCGETKESKEIEALGHSFTNYISDNNATCSDDGTETAKCDRCDATDTRTVEGSKLPHTYSKWSSDEKDHWKECDVCHQPDAISEIGPHEFEWVTDKEATAEEPGLKHEECTVCGYARDAVAIPATGTGTPTDPTNPSDSTVPAEGTEAGSTQNTDANAQTGDEFNMGILLAVMALAGTAAAGTVVIRRRNG